MYFEFKKNGDVYRNEMQAILLVIRVVHYLPQYPTAAGLGEDPRGYGRSPGGPLSLPSVTKAKIIYLPLAKFLQLTK